MLTMFGGTILHYILAFIDNSGNVNQALFESVMTVRGSYYNVRYIFHRLTLNVPDEGYSRKASCALSKIWAYVLIFLYSYSKIIHQIVISNRYHVVVGQFWRTKYRTHEVRWSQYISQMLCMYIQMYF